MYVVLEQDRPSSVAGLMWWISFVFYNCFRLSTLFTQPQRSRTLPQIFRGKGINIGGGLQPKPCLQTAESLRLGYQCLLIFPFCHFIGYPGCALLPQDPRPPPRVARFQLEFQRSAGPPTAPPPAPFWEALSTKLSPVTVATSTWSTSTWIEEACWQISLSTKYLVCTDQQ